MDRKEMTILTKPDRSEVKIIAVLPDFVFCGKRRKRVKVEFLHEEIMYPEPFRTDVLVEDLDESEEGEIVREMEKVKHGNK